MDCEIIATMKTIDWVCLFILIVFGVWKCIDIIHYTPRLANKIIEWVNK